MKKPTAGIILAAGMSERLGRSKPLLEFRGKYLIRWALDAALNSHLESLILVLGHNAQNILQALGEKLRHPRLHIVINSEYREGQSQSLRAGLLKAICPPSGSADDGFPSVMFLLGDQPFADSKMINCLLGRFWKSEKDICVPVCQGKRGNPTIFSRVFYNQLLSIKGDIGAREIICSHPESVLYAEVDNPLCFFDIDTEEDIASLPL